MIKIKLALIVILVITSCNSFKVLDTKYKYSKSTTEFGSIGISKSSLFNNKFYNHVFPKLENKIRVDVKIVPFSKKTFNFYKSKSNNNSENQTIQYLDSLAIKPEFIVISVLDASSYINEINASYNKQVLNYLEKVNNAQFVTGIATTLSNDIIAKIKLADSYYIINTQDNKYSLITYKANKKIDSIDLQSGVVLGFESGKFCWSLNNNSNWILSDIVKECISCQGNTENKIPKNKKNKNLFKL